MDIFNNYKLQREELLARIAQELELDKSRRKKMETAYKAVSEVLQKDSEFFGDLEIVVYAQGSARIGTTVKPINGDDFDLDTVLHIYDIYNRYSPREIYNSLVRVLEGDSYYKTIMEKKDRCVRLNYKDDFHMDILPACMQTMYDFEKIAIPEKALNSWSSGNPKGYAKRFTERSNSVTMPMLKKFSDSLIKASLETEPLPEDFYDKTPLQRAVQLIKRYRDVYYEDKKYPVSSIVLTTLISESYQGEESIFDAISNIVSKIKQSYSDSVSNGKRFKVFNPVDHEEEFTDSWNDEHYRSFSLFINDFYSNWIALESEFNISGINYIKLFGEGIYKKSLQSQIKLFSKSSGDDLTRASGIILGDNAKTDRQGKISDNRGVKNEPYHSYGGE